MASKRYLSPNFDERGQPIEMIVLHYTGMKSGQEAIDRLCDPASKVSAHYVLEEDGTLYNLVPEEKRAWHAGISYWRGRENVNACSIGIEIVNPGHEWGYRPFTENQYTALINLCLSIKKTYGLRDIDIVGHSDVAPERKEDPGELFDWKRLAENGIGLYPYCHPSSPTRHPSPPTRHPGSPTRHPSEGWGPESKKGWIPASAGMTLKDLGYKTHDTASITAFQRHWRQSRVDGAWDEECCRILENLLEQAGR